MTTAKRIHQLESEVKTLKSLVFSLVPLDKEGEYTNNFIKQLTSYKDVKVAGKYTGKGSLLASLK